MKFKIKIYPSIGDSFVVELNDDSIEECYSQEQFENAVDEWIDDHLRNVDDWMFYEG